jgi:membrane fusion protein (multidrug efflux system)
MLDESGQSPVASGPPEQKPSRMVAATGLVIVLAAAAGTATLFFRGRAAQARQVEQLQSDLSKGPLVRVAQVKLAASERLVTLPAEVRADFRTTLYAKVSGYLKEVRVDKGDKVKAGQILAILESPDLDEQVRSAEAELILRKQQLDRTNRLLPSGRVSIQDRETADEAVKVAVALLNRAKVQKDYEIIRAPFAGTITARYADPGALLPAATGSTSSAQPVLDLGQLDKLRVALNLAQDDAARVSTGDTVKLEISPDEPAISARISRVSHTLDARTRTMLCEIDLVHPPAGLYPGAFVNASISLHGTPRPLVPTDALVGKSGQLFVPMVTDNKIHFTQVRPGVDDGKNVEVLEGLHGGEWVALNLGTDVPDGASVRVQTSQPAQ